MRLFDTHAHLDDAEFDAIRTDVVDRAASAGVERIICVGVDGKTSERCLSLAADYSILRAAVGIQPNYVLEVAPGEWDQILELAKHDAVVALGETGLDRYWEKGPIDVQQDYFDRHIRLSQVTGLPFIVHMRDCDEDVLQMLREARGRGPLTGVMHSFTGKRETARECLELGLYISFAGMVTFPKSTELREIASQVPLDRLLVETDSPYLSPMPKRGQRPNEPARVLHTVECLAKCFCLSPEELGERTTENAYRLFARCR